jgi:UDP-N-acetylglucosamine 2-epimerase (non-hydrolysing)
LRLFELQVHHDLDIMQPHQTPSQVCARVLCLLEPVLLREKPDFILVQGDTSSALAAALAGYHCGIPVGHVEAGLRTTNPRSPFPEEMNRRLVSRLATFHFAATELNRATLLKEGVPGAQIFLTGNPVVDALHFIRERAPTSASMRGLLAETAALKRITLTTHRRESFGQTMQGNLQVLRRFIEGHADTCLIFPVHPNPNVTAAVDAHLRNHPRIRLLEPLDYPDFITLLGESWLVVSDSGGVQEEAPSLGVPLLVLRENTERPEAITAGVARLVGGHPETLARLLQEVYQGGTWKEQILATENPFGRGDSRVRIVRAIEQILLGEARHA